MHIQACVSEALKTWCISSCALIYARMHRPSLQTDMQAWLVLGLPYKSTSPTSDNARIILLGICELWCILKMRTVLFENSIE